MNSDNVEESFPNILLYLGAGASSFANYRTFADFPLLLFDKKIRQAEQLPSLPPNAERLLGAIKDSLEKIDGWTTHDRFLWTLNEYQKLLDLNVSDLALQPFLRAATQLYDLYICTTEAVNVMANTTIRHYSSNKVNDAKGNNLAAFNNMQRVWSFYSELAKLNGPLSCLPIFTTNYDMLIEDLYTEFSSPGANSKLVNGIANLDRDGGEWSSNLYAHTRSSSTFHLYRLHGCACWYYHQQGDSSVYCHRNNSSNMGVRNLCAMYPGLEHEKGAGPHGFGFRRFYNLLQKCKMIIFIGFSFRDDDVMHILLKALAERHDSLKILVVDKLYSSQNIQGRLKEGARRSTFPTYVPAIKEIEALTIDFGVKSGFENEILNKCKSLI
jgi:hypothetical protein